MKSIKVFAVLRKASAKHSLSQSVLECLKMVLGWQFSIGRAVCEIATPDWGMTWAFSIGQFCADVVIARFLGLLAVILCSSDAGSSWQFGLVYRCCLCAFFCRLPHMPPENPGRASPPSLYTFFTRHPHSWSARQAASAAVEEPWRQEEREGERKGD